MMRMSRYVCETCRTVWRVVGDTSDLQGLKDVIGDKPNCPRPLCKGRLELHVTFPSGLYRGVEVPITNFFRAVLGFGSPDGTAATLKDFVDILTTKRVSRVDAFDTGTPERVILKRLVMEDGTCLHFETSAKGACCFYIEKPGPSCLEVVDGEFRESGHQGDHSSASPSRKKAGRAYSDEALDVFPKLDLDDESIELPESERMPSLSEKSRVSKAIPIETHSRDG